MKMYPKKRLLKSMSTKIISSKDPLNSNNSNNQKYEENTLTPLSRNDFDMNIINSWIEIRTGGAPKRRSFHVSFLKGNWFYIYGGKDISEGKLNDMWKIDLTKTPLHWEEIKPQSQSTFPHRVYHSGTEVNGKVYIIGGRNEYNYQTNDIYEFDIEKEELKQLTDFGENGNILPPLEQHSAVYDNTKNEIIIFGGFSCGDLLNKMYVFNIETHAITEVDYHINEYNNKVQQQDNINNNDYDDIDIPKPRCGHSALFIENTLLIIGGCANNGELLNDIWQFHISNSTWERLSPEMEHPTTRPIPFMQDNIRENIPSSNGASENNKNIITSTNWPHKRSGQSVCMKGNYIYLFGGKIGNLNEANDFWKYNLHSKQFELIHDTLLEQYSKAELDELTRIEELEAQKKKNFRLLSKKEIEDRKNPFSKKYIGTKGNKLQTQMVRSRSTIEMKNKYEKEIFANSGFHSMKYSSIFNLDDKGVQKAITDLNSILPSKIGNGKDPLTGHVPLPRDGQSMNLYGDKIIIFGGDRNKYPFNDLYFFSLVPLNNN